MIKAVVFDFDGLIMDTETSEYQVIADLYQAYGGHMSMDVWESLIGAEQEAFDLISYLEEQTSQVIDREQFMALREMKTTDALRHAQSLPGVVNLLKEAKVRGLKIGLASSSKYVWVEGHLRHLGLYDMFDCLFTVDDVAVGKPDPALYQKAVQCLDVAPEEALAFEDSLNGATAAKRAGLSCIVVPNQMTKRMDFARVGVDDVLETLADVDLSIYV